MQTDTFWRNIGTSFPMELSSKYTEKVLSDINPYSNFLSIEKLTPSMEQLIEASSILSVSPEYKERSFAEEIAYKEYCHYVAQTYYFEVLGFQIIASAACMCPSIPFYHELLSQAFDEVRHIQIYHELCKKLKIDEKWSPSIPRIFSQIIENNSLEEKIVKGLIVLESMAVGIFSARTTYYGDSQITEIDKQTMIEETEHLNHSTDYLAFMLENKMTTSSHIKEIAKVGAKEISLDVLPVKVIDELGLDFDEIKIAQLKTRGIVASQKRVTQRKIISTLSKLDRYEKKLKSSNHAAV